MDTVNVQSTAVPALGFGTWELEGDDCLRGVRHALEVGYRHIDTAQVYGNEEQVGEAMQASGVARGDIFLTTKIWNSRLDPVKVRSSSEYSLRNLRTDYVDLLLIHWPARMDILPATLEAMMELRAEGKVRHVGISNFTAAQMQIAMEHAPIFTNQVEHHPYLGQQTLRALCVDAGVMLTAYSPLARGRVPSDPVLAEIGTAHGKSATQVALRWLIQQPNVSAVPKSASEKHIESNFDIFDFVLSDDEVARIDALDSGERIVEPEWSPDWDA